MDINDAKNVEPNSYSYKQKQKEAQEVDQTKVQTVVGAKVKKKNAVTKFSEVFIADEAKDVKTHIFMEILVPALKKLACDSIIDATNMIFYGGTRKSDSKSSRSYSSFYKDPRDEPRHDRFRDEPSRGGEGYKNIYYDYRSQAEEVLIRMDELIDRYSRASIADLYDIAQLTSMSVYTDNDFGWTDLRDARVVHTRDGWGFDLPRPRSLK